MLICIACAGLYNELHAIFPKGNTHVCINCLTLYKRIDNMVKDEMNHYTVPSELLREAENPDETIRNK